MLKEEEPRRKKGEFLFYNDRPFWSILAHLQEECSGNVHIKGVVNITSTMCIRNECYQITDYGWTDYWRTVDREGAYICFDFKERAVCLKKYGVTSAGILSLGPSHHVIQDSMDGQKWQEIDRR